MKNRAGYLFLIRFGVLAFAFWGITWAIIGLSSRGNYYSGFVAHCLNYPEALRTFVLKCAYLLLNSTGYTARFDGKEFLLNTTGGGVHMAYACMGFGISAIWLAFVIAYNPLPVVRKIVAGVLGILVLFGANVLRIWLLFVTPGKAEWHGIEHHDLYNYIIHLLVLLLALWVIASGNGKKVRRKYY